MSEPITESKFLSKLVADIDELPYVLEQPFGYRSVILQGEVQIPAGFKTDLYSIPTILQNLIPREGKANGAAVVHDLLYQTGKFGDQILTQSICDDVINEAMACGGMPLWRRVLIYRGLQLFGFVAWNNYRAGRRTPGVI